MSHYYPTNSNGNGYDNTASYNRSSGGAIYDDTPLAMGNSVERSPSNDGLSSSPSSTSSVYNDQAEESPLPSVRGTPVQSYTQQPHASNDDEYQRGWLAGYNAAMNERLPQSQDAPMQRQQTRSMLDADPTATNSEPQEKYQIQFQAAGSNSRLERSNMGPSGDDAYEHGGMPMNSSGMPSTNLSTTGIGSGAGSGRRGLGIGRQPGLANVNSGMNNIHMAGTSTGGLGMSNKPGTGGWKGAAKRLARGSRKGSK